MSARPKSLMTLYAEGSLISRELTNMMVDYAAEARFDREMVDDVDLLEGRPWGEYSRTTDERVKP